MIPANKLQAAPVFPFPKGLFSVRTIFRLQRGLVPLLLLLALSLPLAALPEQAALASFKKELLAIQAFTQQEEATLKGNPLGGILTIRQIAGKLKRMETDGLPPELKAGFNEFVIGISRFADLFEGWPDQPDEIQAYIRKKAAADPTAFANLDEKIKAAEKQLQPATKRLDELGKKYGFDSPSSSISPAK